MEACQTLQSAQPRKSRRHRDSPLAILNTRTTTGPFTFIILATSPRYAPHIRCSRSSPLLRSTNSLDYLFLTRFLHRAYPTPYIVTMGSDLLFAREVDSTEFRGVISLSSFPLLPRGQDWTKQLQSVPQHAHRVFGSYTMEGDYLAVRYLITDPPVSPEEAVSHDDFKHPVNPDMPDYALPFWV